MAIWVLTDRLDASNGEVVFSTEVYANKLIAQKAIKKKAAHYLSEHSLEINFKEDNRISLSHEDQRTYTLYIAPKSIRRELE